MPADYLDNIVSVDERNEVQTLLHKKAKERLALNQPKQYEESRPPNPKAITSTFFKDLKDLALMEQACGVGDIKLFLSMTEVRTKPNFACALAAAKGGHKVILQKIIDEMEPNENQLGTLIETAMGRGNLGVIAYLLVCPNVDDQGKIGGKWYSQVARERAGPKSKTEVDIFSQAFRKSLKNRSGLHGKMADRELAANGK